ncbi:hypothetical protein QYS46_07950 [Klebsiella michiganensis]|nr:hypothetical protein [Klebsiella michiganensis]
MLKLNVREWYDPGWQRCPQGLFLDVPYLLLTEHAWDPAAQTSSTRFMAIEESGKVTRFGSRMTAWHDDAYLDLLRTAGLTTITRPDEAEWYRSAKPLPASCTRC